MVKGPRAPQTGSTSRRGEPVFYVFDLLWLGGGEDRRSRPLIERKRLLRPILPEQPSVMLCAEHIERTGMEFFRVGCEQDLEGIVAKAKHGAYGEKWFKIRNPRSSQIFAVRGSKGVVRKPAAHRRWRSRLPFNRADDHALGSRFLVTSGWRTPVAQSRTWKDVAKLRAYPDRGCRFVL